MTGENIADNGGLKASFHAYLDHSKDAPVNFTLPGLKYNHRQLFFISFAQVSERLRQTNIHFKYNVFYVYNNLNCKFFIKY